MTRYHSVVLRHLTGTHCWTIQPLWASGHCLLVSGLLVLLGCLVPWVSAFLLQSLSESLYLYTANDPDDRRGSTAHSKSYLPDANLLSPRPQPKSLYICHCTDTVQDEWAVSRMTLLMAAAETN